MAFKVKRDPSQPLVQGWQPLAAADPAKSREDGADKVRRRAEQQIRKGGESRAMDQAEDRSGTPGGGGVCFGACWAKGLATSVLV